MQIFELTQPKKRKLNELDFGGPLPKKNFGTGVGPGVQPQYTATPRMKSAPQPGPAPQLPAPAGNQVATNAPAPELQTIDAPPQLTGPTAAKQIGMNDPNVVDVVARPKTKTSAQQSALPAPATPAAPAIPAAAPEAEPAVAAPATPAAAPEAEPAVAPPTDANKIKQTPNQAEKVDIGGSIVRALRRNNANQAGLGWLNPDERNNPNNVQADKEGKITINGKPYNANDPAHVKAYKDYLNLASGGSPTAVATPAQPANTAQITPAAPTPAPTAGAPEAEPSGVEQALIKLGYSPQQAAISAKKIPPGMSEQDAIKLALSGKLRESLTWSRGFDPGRILYNKMKSQQ